MAATEAGTRAARTLDGLYRTHVAEVYRYAYAVLGNRADAEDVTQTTFVNALRALERGERPRKPGNWLIVIAHNIVRQRFRHEQSHPAEVALDRDVAAGPVADDDAPTLDELMQALQRIPPAQREAIVMRELEGRSYKEISEILGLTTGALETLLFRARRSIAEEMESLVTCEKAELALSRQLDGRLARKERRRLDEHLADCPSCARLAERQKRHRYAFRGLAVLPLPLSLTLFKGAPSATAATAVPMVGTATGAGGAVAGAGAGGAAFGGLLASAAAVKVAAVVAAVGVAGAVGAAGYEHIGHGSGPSAKAAARGTAGRTAAERPEASSGVPGRSAGASGHGSPAAERPQGDTGPRPGGTAVDAPLAQSRTGPSREATAPGRLKQSAALDGRSRGAKPDGATKPGKARKGASPQKVHVDARSPRKASVARAGLPVGGAGAAPAPASSTATPPKPRPAHDAKAKTTPPSSTAGPLPDAAPMAPAEAPAEGAPGAPPDGHGKK